MVSVFLSARSTFCCGHAEIGSFRQSGTESLTFSAKTFHEAWLKALRNECDRWRKGQVFTIWFYNPPVDYEGNYGEVYQSEDLRQIVRAIPGVLHLGETKNPNSGNMIDGYKFIWTGDLGENNK